MKEYDVKLMAYKFLQNSHPLDIECFAFFLGYLHQNLKIPYFQLLSNMNEALFEWDVKIIKKVEVLKK